MAKKILFLTPYPQDEAPSQRFRFEQYYSILESNGVSVTSRSFLTLKGWQVLYSSGNGLLKAFHVLWGYFRRVRHLFETLRADYVFVHREAAPLGPPIIEFVVAKIFRKRIIYDFDDSIWIPNTSKQNSMASFWKWNGKVKSICKWSRCISVGNEYLAEFALIYNDRVYVVPTTIDNSKVGRGAPVTEVTTLGWTGTHSTLKYLEQIADEINPIIDDYGLKFKVICNQEPSFFLKNMMYKKWSKESEVEDLSRIDIGLMPLDEDDWSKGKCGFKALQYMALGIPCVISPVGVNKQIINDSSAGLLSEEGEWAKKIEMIVKDFTLRKTMAQNGVNYILSEYTNAVNSASFLALFEK